MARRAARGRPIYRLSVSDRAVLHERIAANWQPGFAALSGVDVLPLAGIDEGVPATGAGAEKADLAVVIGLRAHPLHRGLGIADHLGVGNAAVGAHLGGDVVRVALARTLIEVGADREIAVMREPPRGLDVELAPARQVVDQHHARKGTWPRRLGHISGN